MHKFKVWHANLESTAQEITASTPRIAAEQFVDAVSTWDHDDGDEVSVVVQAEDGTITHWSVEVEVETTYRASESEPVPPPECSCGCESAPECPGT